METTKNLSEMLSYIQFHLKAPKDARNDFGKYNYRNADSILVAFKKTAIDAGFDVYITIDTKLVELQTNIFIEAIATIHCGKTNNKISANAFALHPFNQKGMSESQMTGSAITYAKKYALCNLFAIDDSSEDPDTSFNSLLNSVQGATDIATLNAIKTQSEQCNLKANEKSAITNAITQKLATHVGSVYKKIANATTVEELTNLYKSQIDKNAFLTTEQRQELITLCSKKKEFLQNENIKPEGEADALI